MGENIVEAKNEGKKAAAAEGGVKKDDTSMTVVLKLDLHCEGCAKKVRRSVAHLEGVATVKAECEAKKLTVKGNVDPTWLREKVETKTKKKVELISPLPINTPLHNKADEETKFVEKKPQHINKPKDVAVSTVIMKTKLHCDGCAHKIKRIIIKNFDGVDSVITDLQKDFITVIGKIEVNELMTFLREKLKRGVEIVPLKKEEDGAAVEKKAEKEKGGGDGEKKEKEQGSGGGEEKKSKGKEKKEGESRKVEMSKMEHHINYNIETHYAMPMVMHQDHGMYHHQSYVNNGPPLPPPTYVNMNDNMFSDENPNGCRLM